MLSDSSDEGSQVSRYAAPILGGTPPSSFREPLTHKCAEREKFEATLLVIMYLESVLADHSISDEEIREARHLQRLMRVEEGDLIKHHPERVQRLVGREIRRIQEDERIDATEALHKVRLQELMGLGYDEFLELAGPTMRDSLIPQPRDAADGPAGWVYLLINPSMPGMVKVGMTKRQPEERLVELSGATGVPTPFQLIHSVYSEDCADAERRTHEWLSAMGCRVSSNREFFAAPVPAVIEYMSRL